jgi:hypothetical protein
MEYEGIRSKRDHSWRGGYRCLDRTLLCLPREEGPSSCGVKEDFHMAFFVSRGHELVAIDMEGGSGIN